MKQIPCDVRWCIALASPNRRHCAVHEKMTESERNRHVPSKARALPIKRQKPIQRPQQQELS